MVEISQEGKATQIITTCRDLPRESPRSIIKETCEHQPRMVDVGEIRKEGWVNKESAVIRTYRKRWMVLTPDRLYSFKGETSRFTRPRRAPPPRPARNRPHSEHDAASHAAR